MSPNIDVPFFRILSDSYGRLLGKPLVPAGMSAAEGARWLYEAAPFGILAHGVAADPVFVYGNARAQAIFGYDWDELTALPSRFSAEPMERSERQRFLEQVARDGFVSGYRGIRITKSGTRFWIEHATVWQLTAPDGNHCGQAAMIPEIHPIG
ncbi:MULTISPECIES: MEKHLA domain-containing protein [Burkholderia cepacia complex]|uniref:MEKHLA domain-containing protein n=1 Tax=Burkholderia ubonensis TaxID=101571 RepID=A0A1B4LK03_9BURK|nr:MULTISPECIES: MEKHLA domain-containing protein [Burkholderia cepacia complex]AOJ77467.1 MEKHLA domain-containing protein [Burkholderia ubonensis]AOK13272.1 MEKHLA domain-containing protein [Burkholderia vietnamiensis]CAG9202781.1 MEKHLA domain-containing protein [Burkholderia vietnamiensis]